jgi:uncharacterized membrane protein (UPF0127 family)
VKIVNRTQGTLLGAQISLADTWWTRFRGYLGRSAPKAGEGILLAPCSSIHTFGMVFPIDVVFLNSEGAVVELHEGLRPWKLCRGTDGSRYVLELPEGTVSATRTTVGDELSWTPERAAAWWKTPADKRAPVNDTLPNVAMRWRST